jgi:hypothetical protein
MSKSCGFGWVKVTNYFQVSTQQLIDPCQSNTTPQSDTFLCGDTKLAMLTMVS